jgi:uncharacterized protein (DUF885 family)
MKNIIKIFPKSFTLILVIAVFFSSFLSSCTSGSEPFSITVGQPPGSQQETPRDDLSEQKRFDEFLNEDFINNMTSDAITLHMNLRTPENFGIVDAEISWGSMLEASIPEEDIKEIRETIETFRTFDRAALLPEQQESYDLYLYDAELFEEWLSFYYYNIAFQGDKGIHLIAPILLSEYSFSREQDIENYLELCSGFGLMFDAHIEFEKIKAEKGLFMSDRLVDYVINGSEEFISKTDDNILIVSFIERMDDADFISDAKKEEYIKRNKEIFNDVIVKAYKTLITEMEQLKGSGKNDKGLSHFKNGKKYYISELKNMGITRSPEELIKIFDKRLKDLTYEMIEMFSNDPDLFETLEDTIVQSLTPEEFVEFLREKTKGDFPALPQGIDYTVKIVDESLRGFAPAFYISPQLDYFKNNSIYYDPAYSELFEEMYFIMAHEGIPGHMLQTVNLYSGTLPDFRKSYYSKSYIEGWAQYVEFYCHKYLGEDDPVVQLRRLDREMSNILSFRVDLGVNYEGWSTKQLVKFLGNNTIFDLPEEVCEDLYFSVIKNPMEVAPYIVGKYEIELMKEEYQSELGSDYNEMLFHEELLKRGAAPFSILREWMDIALLGQNEPLRDAA